MPTRRLSLVATSVAAIVATGAIGVSQTPISIGLVREDGFLIPIATITPDLFEPPIPLKTTVNGEVIRPIEKEWPFKDLGWQLSSGRGEKTEFKTLEPQMVRMPYCSERLMWRTTLRRPPAIEGVAPIEKLGMSVSGTSMELPDDVTSQPDQQSQRVVRQIVILFLAKEKARLSREPGQYAASLAPGSPSVRVRQLVRHAIGSNTVYYFEAIKPLKLSDGAVSPDAGLVTGWIVDSPSGLRDYEVTYKVNDDAYKENDLAVVRGIVRHQGKALWLLEWRGWESEYYTVYDWPSGILRVNMNAYHC